jgi:hypothetical protein
LTQFLKGLNPGFESRRDGFCHQDSLPTLEDAISAMVQEEIRLRVMGSNIPVRSTYTIADNRECYNCGYKGHLSYNCAKPRNYNGGQIGTCGSHGGSRGGMVLVKEVVVEFEVGVEESSSITLIWEQIMRWEQWQKRLMRAPQAPPHKVLL